MGPRVAVLFRGYHAYDTMPPGRNGCTHPPASFDWRGPAPNIERTVLAPLRARSQCVDIFLATYVSDPETQADLEATLRPRATIYNPHNQGLKQSDVLAGGLRLIIDTVRAPGALAYDEVYVLRFDAVYKMPVTDWNLGTGRGIWLPFEDDDNRLVGDIVMVIRGAYMLLKVWHTFDYMAKAGRADMHCFREYQGAMHIPMAFICTGHYCSNTVHNAPSSRNPLYVLYGRAYHFDDAPKEPEKL